MAPKKIIKKSMEMFWMLPKDGLFYEFFPDIERPTSHRILPGWEATDIMTALDDKYDHATRKDFDKEIALLIQKGTEYVKYRISDEGRVRVPGDIPYNSQFWSFPKRDTMFKDVNVATVYRFVLKIMEAREKWIDINSHEQLLNQADYHCDTAKAVDRFNNIIVFVGIYHSDIADNLAIHMTGNMAGQVEDDDIPGQVRVQEDDEVSNLSSDDEQQPNEDEVVFKGDNSEHMNIVDDGQDERMTDSDTDAYDAYLKNMHEEDMMNADDEETMDME